MGSPDVLLVDEPTSALDHERGAAVLDLVVQFAHERGVATVLVTHDHSQLGLVDEIHEMRDGVLSRRISPSNPGRRRSIADPHTPHVRIPYRAPFSVV